LGSDSTATLPQPLQPLNQLYQRVAGNESVTLTAPPNANACPPGHYLLFLLNANGVPSIGKIVQVAGAGASPTRVAVALADPVALNNTLRAKATRPEVIVGLSSTCPYGLAACRGGAYAGLKQLTGVAAVRPLADAAASVAFVYLDHDGLPDIGQWPAEFARCVSR
jgi:hypothetical protein